MHYLLRVHRRAYACVCVHIPTYACDRQCGSCSTVADNVRFDSVAVFFPLFYSFIRFQQIPSSPTRLRQSYVTCTHIIFRILQPTMYTHTHITTTLYRVLRPTFVNPRVCRRWNGRGSLLLRLGWLLVKYRSLNDRHVEQWICRDALYTTYIYIYIDFMGRDVYVWVYVRIIIYIYMYISTRVFVYRRPTSIRHVPGLDCSSRRGYPDPNIIVPTPDACGWNLLHDSELPRLHCVIYVARYVA